MEQQYFGANFSFFLLQLILLNLWKLGLDYFEVLNSRQRPK